MLYSNCYCFVFLLSNAFVFETTRRTSVYPCACVKQIFVHQYTITALAVSWPRRLRRTGPEKRRRRNTRPREVQADDGVSAEPRRTPRRKPTAAVSRSYGCFSIYLTPRAGITTEIESGNNSPRVNVKKAPVVLRWALTFRPGFESIMYTQNISPNYRI